MNLIDKRLPQSSKRVATDGGDMLLANGKKNWGGEIVKVVVGIWKPSNKIRPVILRIDTRNLMRVEAVTQNITIKP
ncbi:hypothetical protein D3C72_2393920 [compost metagenome]